MEEKKRELTENRYLVVLRAPRMLLQYSRMSAEWPRIVGLEVRIAYSRQYRIRKF